MQMRIQQPHSCSPSLRVPLRASSICTPALLSHTSPPPARAAGLPQRLAAFLQPPRTTWGAQMFLIPRDLTPRGTSPAHLAPTTRCSSEAGRAPALPGYLQEGPGRRQERWRDAPTDLSEFQNKSPMVEESWQLRSAARRQRYFRQPDIPMQKPRKSHLLAPPAASPCIITDMDVTHWSWVYIKLLKQIVWLLCKSSKC